MRMRMWVLVVVMVVVAAVAAAAAEEPKVKQPPNFLVLMVDDLGYGDLGCFGRKNVSTPHVDSLCRDGVKMDQFLVPASVCTPSRAGFLTGRLPRRFGMTANVLPWRVMATTGQPTGFPDSEITLPEVLREKGYATGMSGKWHLGISNLTHHWAHLPKQHGFDSWLGLPYTNMHGCDPYHGLQNESLRDCMVMANNTVVSQPTIYSNLTQTLTDHAIHFITEKAALNQPFFFYMAYVHVHTPLFSSPKFKNVSAGGVFGDNVEEMDDSVGQILRALDEAHIANNTLVLLTSDNGPFLEEGWSRRGRTGGLKGGKGQTYEGGIRVPGIARWPGVIPAGTVLHEAVTTLDLMPTFAALADTTAPTDRIIDGANVWEMMVHPHNATRPDPIIWHYCGHNVTAARNGRYKLHFATQIWASDARPTPLCIECCPYSPLSFNGTGGSLCPCDAEHLQRHDPPLIFDMLTDPGESQPLTPETLPNFNQLVRDTKQALAEHYATVHPTRDEMVSLPIPPLSPCCTNEWFIGDACACQIYEEGKVYP
ncbi:steroid sulfatase [Salpingoeca rosetta]|uniref:Steroid sulfatase n=1 Tax=Salpingoeca rosetta (strain ATCC 50818 / BSB-021) TaxID=946362 RepID=F2UKF0_SALR5|nr:steroid sulfatase [Salpingoeca rosetta]EGD77599.1 steroid sulfatase [Salpingoeca rosetta]|eukprot:XP_004990487.1 steroid sulfatase [Salpingoeca rosetta]